MEKPFSPESPAPRGGWGLGRRRRRLRHIALLPTLLTLGNGVCGFAAVLKIGEGLTQTANAAAQSASYHMAAWLILIAMIFDALDGKVARLTRTASNFGAQLDSLSDMLTFGVAPGLLVYAICHATTFLPDRVVEIVSILYVMCVLIRLARFNVETTPDEKSHQEFAGLPSPAAAGVIAAAVIPWTAFPDYVFFDRVWQVVLKALPIVAFVLAVLMVSRIRYVHLVNRAFRGYRPFVTLVEIVLVIVLVALLHEFSLFLAFLAYALLGPSEWLRKRLSRRPAPEIVPANRDETLF